MLKSINTKCKLILKSSLRAHANDLMIVDEIGIDYGKTESLKW